MSAREEALAGFSELDSDEIEKPLEIESLCMNCRETGITKFLLVNIPFFKEIIISAFECLHCHTVNNSVQQASQIQKKGCKIQLKITQLSDLNRSIVKMETALFRIEELDFEIPPNTQPGLFTTIEGILSRAIEGLGQYQPIRKYQQPDVYEAIHATIQKLENILSGNNQVTIILDDPTGNSFIQNPLAPQKDLNMKIQFYNRTNEQNELLGYISNESKQNIINTEGSSLLQHDFEELKQKFIDSPQDLEFYSEEVICIPSTCPSCNEQGLIKMHPIDIPYFKQIIIMAFVCEKCAFKSNEIKSGCGISNFGRRYMLQVESLEDLNRDVLKSESATLLVPHIGLEASCGTLGGRFTTVEGLLTQVRDDLQNNPFCIGDSSTNDEKENINLFFMKLDKLLSLDDSFLLILDDPLGNSYIQNIYAPEPDPRLTTLDYERSFEQNEDFGLNDVKTENY